MPTTLTSLIQTALESDGINFIEIVRIKLPDRYLWISTQEVPDGLADDGIVYEDRLKSIGPLTFKAGFEDSDVTFELYNHDHLMKTLADEGVIWERAEVSVCRLYPDYDPRTNPSVEPGANRVGTWDAPYWRGWIKQAPSFEDVSSMKVSSGFSELTRPCLRKFERTDMSDLGTEQFPYNPLAGKGLPQIKESGTATGGSGTALVTAADISGLRESWLIFVKTKKIIGRIISISTGTGEVEVENWLYGGVDAAEVVPVSGDSWIAGPVYTSYDGMESSCKNMGMFGPSEGQNENDLNTDIRRYFKALSLPGNAYLEKAARIQGLADSLLSSVEGEGDGEVIPVRVGRFEAELKILASGMADDQYVHILGIAGEGRVKSLNEPLLDGAYHVDNINPAAAATDDSWIEGGTEFLGAKDLDGVTDGEITESQRRQAIGSLQSRARNHQETLETYKSNPLGFNDSYGSGVSLDGLAWTRARYQKEGYNFSGEPLVRQRGIGIGVLKPDGTWTNAANIIEFFYWWCRNQRWGAKLALDRLNVADFEAEAEYAGEITSSTSSGPKIFSGTIVAGPEDADAPTLPPCCIIIPDTWPLGETREDGLVCTIVTGTVTYTMTVRGEAELCGPSIMSWIRTPEGAVRSAVIQDEGWLLTFYSNFDGELPEAGDTFTLSGSGLDEEGTLRFPADGSLIKDDPAGEIAESIMKCANGTFIPKQGRMSPVIRRAEDLTVINARRTFTDVGANSNVIFNGGESTFRFTPDDTSKIPTGVKVEFIDVEYGYKKRQITIRNTFAEERLAEMTGENSRDKTVMTRDYPLIGTADRAVYLGTRYLQENSFIRGVPGYIPGDYSLEVPIHYAQDVLPMDVHPIHGGQFPAWCQYMRIIEITDNSDKGTVTIKGRPYLEEMYLDTDTNFVISPGPAIKPPSPGTEYQQLVIESLTEGNHRDDEGTLLVSVSGEITLP